MCNEFLSFPPDYAMIYHYMDSHLYIIIKLYQPSHAQQNGLQLVVYVDAVVESLATETTSESAIPATANRQDDARPSADIQLHAHWCCQQSAFL